MNEVPCTQCFNILGTGSRMKIYNLLKMQGKCSVNGIVEEINLTQPTISYHLNEMKKAGLVESIKEGKYVYYKISGKCPYRNEGCVLNSVKFVIKKHE